MSDAILVLFIYSPRLVPAPRRPPQKTRRRTARHSSPQTPPAVPSDSIFLRLPISRSCRRRQEKENIRAKRLRISFKEKSFWIFGEKSPNINQKRQQFRRKRKIARNRIVANHKWRAGRNSPLKPPFRPARFIAGFFWDFCHKYKLHRSKRPTSAST